MSKHCIFGHWLTSHRSSLLRKCVDGVSSLSEGGSHVDTESIGLRGLFHSQRQQRKVDQEAHVLEYLEVTIIITLRDLYS